MTPTWELFESDCLDILPTLPENCFDSCVSDPPYEIGFMGKDWDRSGIAFRPDTWRAVFRVLKPGAHLLAFGGSRTFHRIACAIEDAGFEIRDTLSWMYGTGFPKSLNVEAAVNQALNPNWESGGPSDPRAAQFAGRGTALKPAWEPIILARKPLSGTVAANVQAYGTGALNIDGCRIASEDAHTTGRKASGGKGGGGVYGDSKLYDSEASPLGRWPANVILDEHAAALLDEQTGTLKAGIAVQRNGGGQKIGGNGVYQGSKGLTRADVGYGDSGGASRFFYVAKASRAERDIGLATKNTHPTVKPIALMRWLVRLITPPGGAIIDPFAGSGSTGVAAIMEGFAFAGVELKREYIEIARSRIQHAEEATRTGQTLP